MKTKLQASSCVLHSALAFLAALALCLSALPARAQDNNVTISAADFQRWCIPPTCKPNWP